MRRLSPVITLILLGLLVAAPAVQAAPRTPFVGAWTSTDVDGSTQYLTISGGTTVRLTNVDTFGTVCANAGAPTDVFIGQLSGTVSGDVLDATFERARCGSEFFDWLVGVHTTLTYDAATDTLSDGFVVWHRH